MWLTRKVDVVSTGKVLGPTYACVRGHLGLMVRLTSGRGTQTSTSDTGETPSFPTAWSD